jgi:hypothetical protein
MGSRSTARLADPKAFFYIALLAQSGIVAGKGGAHENQFPHA